MFKKLLFILLGSIMLLGCYQQKQESPTKGHLTVYVSDGYLSLIQKEALRFTELYPEAEIEVMSTTTREAIVFLLNDSAELILTDRALNEEENRIVSNENLKLRQVNILKDALLILVNRKNIMESISLEQLKQILTGKKKEWQEFSESQLSSPIQLVGCGRNSGIYELVQNHLLDKNSEMMLDQIFSSQSEVITHIANDVSAIGLTSMASYGVIRSTPDTAAVRILKTEVVDSTNKVQTYYPYQAYIYTEEYPLHFPCYLYFMPDRSELAAGFSAFIASAVGQKIILNYGLVPATMPVRLVQLNNEGVNPK